MAVIEGKPLVERSPTAKKAGGSETIRKLPKLHRLLLSAKIASEQGKERAAKTCTKKAIEEEMGRRNYSGAAKIAEEYGLEEEFKEIARKIIKEKMRFKNHSDAVKIARECGLEKEMEKTAKKVIKTAMKGGNYHDAIYIAEEYGLKRELEEAVKEAIKRNMEDGDYEIARGSAELCASKYGLDLGKEIQESTEKIIEKMMLERESEYVYVYTKAMVRNQEYGLTKEKIKEIAERAVKEKIQTGNYLDAAGLAEKFDLTEELKIIKGIQEALRTT